MKVSKELTLYPLGNYKSFKIRVDECKNWNEANEVLRMEYNKMKEYLSDADKEKLDKLLK
jgi:hypothetical protein